MSLEARARPITSQKETTQREGWPRMSPLPHTHTSLSQWPWGFQTKQTWPEKISGLRTLPPQANTPLPRSGSSHSCYQRHGRLPTQCIVMISAICLNERRKESNLPDDKSMWELKASDNGCQHTLLTTLCALPMTPSHVLTVTRNLQETKISLFIFSLPLHSIVH